MAYRKKRRFTRGRRSFKRKTRMSRKGVRPLRIGFRR